MIKCLVSLFFFGHVRDLASVLEDKWTSVALNFVLALLRMFLSPWILFCLLV